MAEQRFLAPLIEVRLLSLQKLTSSLMVRTMVSKTVNMGSNPVSDGFFSRIFYGFWMSKIIKSYYKLITNFQDDLKGSFLNKLKRRQRTLNLLA